MFEFSHATLRRAKQGMLRDWRLQALSVFSLAVTFICLGSALLVLVNLRAVEERWAHAGRMSIYLQVDAKATEVDALKTALGKTPGVTRVRHVSSAQAHSEFSQIGGAAEPLAALPDEAFPASIELDVRPDVTSAELAAIKGKLTQLACVDDIETYEAWTERLSRLVRGGVAAAALLALVVFASVLAVVGGTMRLALQRRRSEVEVLKLVGATPAFVKVPFLIEGSAQGAMGAGFAVVVLFAIFLIMRSRMDTELSRMIGVEPAFLPWQGALAMITVGAVLGTIAAAVGLRKLVTV